MIRNIRWLLLLLLLGGAAAGGCIPKEIPPPLVERVPYKILLHYSSDLANPYYVLSGPFQSYGRFAVNESFQRRLEVYAEAKSTTSAIQTLELTVHAKELLTTYDRLGGLPEERRPSRVAQAGLLGRGDWPLSVFNSRSDGPFDDLPEQITKTATLQLEISISLAGVPLTTQNLAPRIVQILERYDLGLGTYDYHPLISGVQEQALAEIDRLLQRVLPAP